MQPEDEEEINWELFWGAVYVPYLNKVVVRTNLRLLHIRSWDQEKLGELSKVIQLINKQEDTSAHK